MSEETFEPYKNEYGTWSYVKDSEGNGTITGFVPEGNLSETEVVIPENINGIPINKIGDKAFEKQRGLWKLIIPKNIKEIGYCAFLHCSNLKELVIEDGVSKIGKGAFHSCGALSKITIPKSVEVISVGSFAHCTKLQTLTIEYGVVEIESNAFGCTALKSVTIPGSVKKIKRAAFDGCKDLRRVTIESGGNEIETGAFSTCDVLKYVNILGDMDITIGPGAFTLNRDGKGEVVVTRKRNTGRKIILGSIGVLIGATLAAVAFVFFAPIVAAAVATVGVVTAVGSAIPLVRGSIDFDNDREGKAKQNFSDKIDEKMKTNSSLGQQDIEQIGKETVPVDLRLRPWYREAIKSDANTVKEILEPKIYGCERIYDGCEKIDRT